MMFWPLLFFLTGVLFLYLFFLKPHFKEEFKSGRMALITTSSRPLAFQGGTLWRDGDLLWLRSTQERLTRLKSETHHKAGASLALGEGSMTTLKDDRRLDLYFEDARWSFGGGIKGVRTLSLKGLIEGQHYFEILFRLNSMVLLWVLSVIAWLMGRREGTVFFPMAAVMTQYILAFHIIRPLGQEASLGMSLFALLPSLSMIPWIVAFGRKNH